MPKKKETLITSVDDAVRLMSSVAEKSLYRCDKYEVLDAFTNLILCDHFGLEHNRSGGTDETAIALANDLFVIYKNAVSKLAPFEDILGPLYMDIQKHWRGKHPLGEYYTPGHVSYLMAQMAVADQDFSQFSITNPCSMADPCVGSGAMPLAFCRAVLKNHGAEALANVSIFGQDLSHHGIRLFACQMLMNIYAHKLSLAEVIAIHGNSLTLETWSVVLHATHADAIPTDTESVNPAKDDALRAQAEANYKALEENGAKLDELLVGRPSDSK